MRYVKPEIVLALFYTFWIVCAIVRWGFYDGCSNPLSIWLLINWVLLFILAICIVLLKKPLRWNYRRVVVATTLYFLPFLLLGAGIWGCIWLVKSMQESCVPIDYFIPVPFILVLSDLLNPPLFLFLLLKYGSWEVLQILGLYAPVQEGADGGMEVNHVAYKPEDCSVLMHITVNEGNLATMQQYHCSICVEDFKMEDEVIALSKCRHFFHKQCLGEWIAVKPLCPNCRKPCLPNTTEKVENVGLFLGIEEKA